MLRFGPHDGRFARKFCCKPKEFQERIVGRWLRWNSYNAGMATVIFAYL